MKRLAFLLLLCACEETLPFLPHPDGGDVSDAGPDVDNGAPSTNYPAPHPPLPTLVNGMKGPVLTAPVIHLVFFQSHPLEQYAIDYATAMTKSTYWAATTSEYGVGKISFAGVTRLPDPAPAMTSQEEIHTWMAAQIQGGAFGTPDPQAIYTVIYPMGTIITQPNPVSPIFGIVKSCENFGGYHDNVQVGPTNYAYAILPTCSIAASAMTVTLSHEWVEAATDPQVTASGTFTLTGGPSSAFFGPDQDHIIWSLIGGGEAADLCASTQPRTIVFTPPDLPQPTQRSWSNLSAMASHDPCVPRPEGAYFNSAPVLTETVSFESQFTGKVTSKGIKIPVDASRTIEVDLFSDGDTGGPWTVEAGDVLAEYYGQFAKDSMAFSWDRTQGVNGEKLHLTITVTVPSLIGGAHAFFIRSKLGLKTAIWPGLVVED